MKYLRRFFQYLYCVYALITFVIIMFTALPFVVVFSFFGIRGGNIVYIICNMWARIWYGFIFIRHKEIYETAHDKTKQYIFVANHSSYMDIPALVRCMHQPVRVLGKHEMVHYPVFGWIYRAAAIIVDRSSPEKRAKSVRALKAALKHGISIFIFPEGTFNETEEPLKDFYDGAFKIAIETQTPIKPLLFVDTIDRMHWSGIFELTPGRSRVVYLNEISVDGYTVRDMQILKRQVYDKIEEGLRKYRKFKTTGISVKDMAGEKE
ncbi:1-acyl-sn-glycerol-3-phosphate acyltransferase [Panacibacter ginsenosidivorans]|uniref:1-acyl-sn-glycerol-3-phosphate acyltransferase n=1 Tax=Panacibacter ginsenosidivorans TaxID=1813871 RepID=A0A5B8V7Q9_9BACT|nr:lysophospholipid acyltransferase family protein [Panacibacter ginsenosidivorans]QEC66408.1 1-acyl-sn-glycerol-3-phosphate acyltransferase [Panacibacter ginsenosidivorans]